MATIRRLSDDDVRSIFEALHHNKAPPLHLKFQIVPVGPNGLKLSPPSFEFDDGLYVLLRPQKKKKSSFSDSNNNNDVPKPPRHLEHLLMKESPPETCPWSLSGPQFPQPTAIQQRYCYPKGRPEYSSRKGGALWTMYGGADQKEDLEFRLLHVYFSAKRAVNKGLTVPDKELAAAAAASPAKRSKRSPHRFMNVTAGNSSTSSNNSRTLEVATLIQTPVRKKRICNIRDRQGGVDDDSIQRHQSTPMSPETSIFSTLHSPLSTPSTLPPFSPHKHSPVSPPLPWNYDKNFVSPPDHTFNAFFPVDQTEYDILRPSCYSPSRPTTQYATNDRDNDDMTGTRDRKRSRDNACTVFKNGSFGAANYLLEEHTAGARVEDWDAYWNDPLLSLATKTSYESDVNMTDFGYPFTVPAMPDILQRSPVRQSIESEYSVVLSTTTRDESVDDLVNKLDSIHKELKSTIWSASSIEKQGQFSFILANWARNIANDPLGLITLNNGSCGNDEGTEFDVLNTDWKQQHPV